MVKFFDSNKSDANDNQKVVITGGDDQYIADVVLESGLKKLVVKSSSTALPLGNLSFDFAKNAGSSQMAVDGSTTSVEFTIPADTTYDLVIESMAFDAVASSITMDKFLSLNSELTNGILIEVKSEDQVFQFEPIKNTLEFDANFAWGPGRSFDVIFASGNDTMVSRFGPESPFSIKKQGTYASDDYIKVIIRDNLSSIASLKFLTFGKLV